MSWNNPQELSLNDQILDDLKNMPTARDAAIGVSMLSICTAHYTCGQEEASLFVDLLDATCKTIQHASEAELAKFLHDKVEGGKEETFTKAELLAVFSLVQYKCGQMAYNAASDAQKLSALLPDKKGSENKG